MAISGRVAGTIARVACVLGVALCLLLPTRIAGERSAWQQQNQQNCPAQGSQKNGQPQGQSGQQKQQGGANGSGSNKNNANCKNNQPAPLFGGSLSIKKSSQSTDSSALGFNGVDPNGQVQQAFLSASPSSDAVQKAQSMANYRPTLVDLAAFQKDGGLTQSAPPSTN